jgi:hypothetical protein
MEVVLCGGGHGDLHRTQLLLWPRCWIGMWCGILHLLDGAGPVSQTIYETSRDALYTGMRNNALRALCNVYVLVALRVVWTVFLLTRIELALK